MLIPILNKLILTFFLASVLLLQTTTFGNYQEANAVDGKRTVNVSSSNTYVCGNSNCFEWYLYYTDGSGDYIAYSDFIVEINDALSGKWFTQTAQVDLYTGAIKLEVPTNFSMARIVGFPDNAPVEYVGDVNLLSVETKEIEFTTDWHDRKQKYNLGEPITISGTATPGDKIKVKAYFDGKTYTVPISSHIVHADANGHWEDTFYVNNIDHFEIIVENNGDELHRNYFWTTRDTDSTVVWEKPDGTKITTKSTGTIITEYPNGKTVYDIVNGGITTQHPDGSITITMGGHDSTYNTDGTAIKEDKWGNMTFRSSDGTKITIGPDDTLDEIDAKFGINSEIEEELVESVPPILASQSDFIFPDTQKQVFQWWAQGLVSDVEISNNLKYLLRNEYLESSEFEIISLDVPYDSLGPVQSDFIFPDTQKQVFQWWAQGLVSDVEISNNLKYLLRNEYLESSEFEVVEFQKIQSKVEEIPVRLPTNVAGGISYGEAKLFLNDFVERYVGESHFHANWFNGASQLDGYHNFFYMIGDEDDYFDGDVTNDDGIKIYYDIEDFIHNFSKEELQSMVPGIPEIALNGILYMAGHSDGPKFTYGGDEFEKYFSQSWQWYERENQLAIDGTTIDDDDSVIPDLGEIVGSGLVPTDGAYSKEITSKIYTATMWNLVLMNSLSIYETTKAEILDDLKDKATTNYITNQNSDTQDAMTKVGDAAEQAEYDVVLAVDILDVAKELSSNAKSDAISAGFYNWELDDMVSEQQKLIDEEIIDIDTTKDVGSFLTTALGSFDKFIDGSPGALDPFIADIDLLSVYAPNDLDLHQKMLAGYTQLEEFIENDDPHLTLEEEIHRDYPLSVISITEDNTVSQDIVEESNSGTPFDYKLFYVEESNINTNENSCDPQKHKITVMFHLTHQTAPGYTTGMPFTIKMDSPTEVKTFEETADAGGTVSIVIDNMVPGGYDFDAVVTNDNRDFFIQGNQDFVHYDVPECIVTPEPTVTADAYLYRLVGGYEHLYTTDVNEKNNAIANLGYTDEGVEAKIFSTQESGTVPLYRLFNGVNHFYLIDPTERTNAMAFYGYSDEGIEGYVYATQEPGTIPLYRLFNGGDHFYTTDLAEKNNTVANLGYADEGIECYVYPN